MHTVALRNCFIINSPYLISDRQTERQSVMQESKEGAEYTRHSRAALKRKLICEDEDEDEEEEEASSISIAHVVEMETAPTAEDGGSRERLKKHWVEVAGRVRIPDTWAQESFLKDWIDSAAAFDASLLTTPLMSARASLAAQGRRRAAGAGNSNRLII
ncbi:protein BIC1-like [Andrographis paniculata]|uniref:protein BIC1-like n=1 Tax=Andrographis paniculata TaxID=175694 RepID=UPI0021E8697A|nr:protein BIC1-like [Andrographis paniculata]